MNFAALSKLMYDEDGIIKAVELAPNGVVRSVYPQASNADALGLDWESFLDEIQINKLQDASYEYLIWKESHNGERVIIAQGDRPVGPNTLEVACAVPIIAMTANAFEEDKQRAFDAGMNDHISKPISVNALLAALRKNPNVLAERKFSPGKNIFCRPEAHYLCRVPEIRQGLLFC